MTGQMPSAEVALSVSQVETLVADQAPRFAGLPVVPFSNGWDNFMFRLGDDWLARFPRREMAVPLIRHEARWLPELAPRLPLSIPAPVATGEPGQGYPWPWTIVPWIDGVAAASSDLDAARAADDLAGFLRALHLTAPEEAPPNPYRGGPLQDRDQGTKARIDRLSEIIDADRAEQLWKESLAAAPYEYEPVWLHGDLHAANVIAAEAAIVGIVDFGDITSGDPATDLSAFWTVLAGKEEGRFRDAYGGVDDSTWQRAKGWALSLGLVFLDTSADNPAMGAIGVRTVEAVLGGAKAKCE